MVSECYLVVGLLGDEVCDATGEEGPLGRVAGKVVVLHVLLQVRGIFSAIHLLRGNIFFSSHGGESSPK